MTTTCVTVVLKGKLLELEVDVERDDEGLEPDNDVSQHYIVVSIDICGLSVSRITTLGGFPASVFLAV